MNPNSNSPKLQKPCEYNYPNCQKVTDLQYIRKLGAVTISKTWICDHCKAYLDQQKSKQ